MSAFFIAVLSYFYNGLRSGKCNTSGDKKSIFYGYSFNKA